MINDSTMKLFGRTIFLTHNHIDVSSNDSSLEFATHIPYEDLSDHSLHSSLSSSSPLEVNSQTQHDAKRYKVCSMPWLFYLKKFFYFIFNYVVK
jgi:hypothetical protein